MGDNTALYKKLMLDKLRRRLILAKPPGYTLLDGAGFDDARTHESFDLVFQFVADLDDLERAVRGASDQDLIADGGYLYLAYPKKGNKAKLRHINRDDIADRFGLDHGDGFVTGTRLKFSKMVSLDETYTVAGLRHFKSPDYKAPKPACSTDDYAGRIPELREALSAIPEILALFDRLTPGYRKDWARYVYSAKTGATTEKRLAEMACILSEGYKSKDLHRQRKK